MSSQELDHLTQGNHEFSIYYAKYQRLMAILDYDSKAKKAALKRAFSRKLQARLVYQTDEPKDFNIFMELYMKLDYRIRAHTALSHHSNNSHLSSTKATPSTQHTLGHPTSTDSGNCSPAPIDLSAATKSQNQCRYDEWIAKGLCLYCGLADHFKDQCPILASNNARKVRLAATGISTPNCYSVPSPASDSVKRVIHQQPIGSVGGPTLVSLFVSTQDILYISASLLSNKHEIELDGNYLIGPYTLSDDDLRIDTYALIDCVCTRLSFMNTELTCQQNFPCYQLKTPKTVEVIDG
jgi:hypothetical protein